MENNILIDYINIKNLPELIIDSIKKSNPNSNLNSVRIIYSTILKEISYDIEGSYLSRITKYLSSSEASNIAIFDDINDGIYDKELMSSIKIINSNIKDTNLYNKLFNLCYFIHFEDNEYNSIKESFNNNDFDEFMFLLFKHAFLNYKFNTPKILAQRLFEDASTYKQTYPLKLQLFKIAGELGHSEAAFNYALEADSYEDKIRLLLKSKDFTPSLWQIGWEIENFKISNDQLIAIQNNLSDIINFSKKEISKISSCFKPNDFKCKCLITAFHIYYYLALNKNFSKGYNSIGKLLINKLITINSNSEQSIEIGINYLKKGASLSNIHAMQNLAIYYRKHNGDINVVKELLQMGADNEDLLSCVELSKILMNEGKNEEAIDYLKYAASKDNDYAQFKLGKYYENKFDYSNAKYWYKEAIKNGNYKTVIDLALLYFQEYIENDNPMLLTTAITLLKNNLNNFDDESLKTATKLLSDWTKE